MRAFGIVAFVSSLASFSYAVEENASKYDHYATLLSSYGAVEPVNIQDPYWVKEVGSRSSEVSEVRTPEKCVFPIDVVIVQDSTNSFQNDFPNMKDHEVPIMIETLSKNHPGSRFGIISHTDKPIEPFGWPYADDYHVVDYCYKQEQALTGDVVLMQNVYDRLFATGGNDAPENQFGAMVGACQSTHLGWTNDMTRTKLLVVATDSAPHYEKPGMSEADYYGMKPFEGVFNEDDIEVQCRAEYYPKPATVVENVHEAKAYVAFLVGESDDLAYSEYIWFNRKLGQLDSFVKKRKEDSSDFWEKLSDIITVLESIECRNPVTTTKKPEEGKIPHYALVQDLSHSYTNDYEVAKIEIPAAIAEIHAEHPLVQFALSGFVDKPVAPYGDVNGDFCYELLLPMTNDIAKITEEYKNLRFWSGLDLPEIQLDAVVEAVLSNKTGFTGAANEAKMVMLITDSVPHMQGDASQLGPNTGGLINCLGEDYISQAKFIEIIKAENVIPVFAVRGTEATKNYYKDLAEAIATAGGFSRQYNLNEDYSNLKDIIEMSLVLAK